jgi:hypothetical protein
MHITF